MLLQWILGIVLLNLQIILVGFVSVKWIRFFRKVAEENKRNIIEGLKHLQTVGETKKIFSERQYNWALVAINIYHRVGAPNFQNLNKMIRQNIIHNFPVTVEDIEIAEKIFGPDVSTLKVKTTRQRPKVVVNYFIWIPR